MLYRNSCYLNSLNNKFEFWGEQMPLDHYMSSVFTPYVDALRSRKREASLTSNKMWSYFQGQIFLSENGDEPRPNLGVGDYALERGANLMKNTPFSFYIHSKENHVVGRFVRGFDKALTERKGLKHLGMPFMQYVSEEAWIIR